MNYHEYNISVKKCVMERLNKLKAKHRLNTEKYLKLSDVLDIGLKKIDKLPKNVPLKTYKSKMSSLTLTKQTFNKIINLDLGSEQKFTYTDIIDFIVTKMEKNKK